MTSSEMYSFIFGDIKYANDVKLYNAVFQFQSINETKLSKTITFSVHAVAIYKSTVVIQSRNGHFKMAEEINK